MIDGQSPLPEPRGGLVPPGRLPPTAIGVATPPPPEPIHVWIHGRRPLLRRLMSKFLDSLNGLGDSLARTLHVR